MISAVGRSERPAMLLSKLLGFNAAWLVGTRWELITQYKNKQNKYDLILDQMMSKSHIFLK